ncbi:MAG: hypothetical protein J6Y78_06415 [Paludibacteraceae bacterium]|nr:hypothetical protein [Paludibacteraceae bacterium]
MSFFFFFDCNNEQNNANDHKVNAAVYNLRNRTDVLELEAKILVLRLLQLRDSGKTKIISVKQDDKELPSLKKIKDIDLSEISIEEINKLSSSIGYTFTNRIKDHSQIYSKVNIEVNGKKYGIRCFDHTERPLINHSTREKYEKLCKRVGIKIDKLDSAVNSYWECREAGVFNEDCIYTSPLNPFLNIKEDLRVLLTYIAFHAYNINKDYNDPYFELEELDGYIDYTNPCEESTWDVLDKDHFFDKVWTYLRFSFRADRGMPNDGLVMPSDKSILKWTRQWKNKKGETVFKGALHIRISKYNTAINDTPFDDLFSVQHMDEIREVSINQGEKDEYLLKLFLVECRKNNRVIPIGDQMQIVKNVENSKREEIDYPDKIMNWKSISSGLLVYMCHKIKAGKSGAFDKADVFINGVGVSVKSQRGAAPSIINQTTRDKILRVMNVLNFPIEPIDHIVNRYWFLRLNGGKEDVCGLGQNNPFTTCEDGASNLSVMKPLLNYFTFKGTGTRDSTAPATYVLSVDDPEDISTWIYYSEDNFVDSVWEKLVFSIRAKGLPSHITDDMLPWIREIDGIKKGTLNVRVNK